MDSIVAELASNLLRTLPEHFRSALDESRPNPHSSLESVALEKDIALADTAINSFIKGAAEWLSITRCRLNRHALIHRLPTEIISLIFEHAGQYERHDDTIFHNEVPLNILRVSKDWRQIAMDTPRIWAQIDLMSESLLPIFIERSKSVPLGITLRRANSDPRFHGHLLRILPFTERYGSLVMDLGWMNHPESEIVTLFASPVPLLEVLNIEWRGKGSDAYTSMSRMALPPTAHMPRLRHLITRGFFIPYTHPVFSGLTVLSLGNIEHSNPNSIHEILRAIDACPLLESLTLITLTFPVAPLSLPLVEMGVSLPRIRHYEVRLVTAWATQLILSCISVPASAQKELSVDLEGDMTLDRLLPPYTRNLLDLASATNLRISPSGYGTETADSGGSFCIHVSRQKDYVFSWLGNVRMPNLQTLSVTSFGKRSSTAFSAELGRYSSITELTFHNCTESAIEGLCISPTAHRHVCPLLHTISIFGSNVSEDIILQLVRYRTPIVEDADSFSPALALGARLRCIHLGSCSRLTRATVVKLLEYLAVVYWDGERFERVEAGVQAVDT